MENIVRNFEEIELTDAQLESIAGAGCCSCLIPPLQIPVIIYGCLKLDTICLLDPPSAAGTAATSSPSSTATSSPSSTATSSPSSTATSSPSSTTTSSPSFTATSSPSFTGDAH